MGTETLYNIKLKTVNGQDFARLLEEKFSIVESMENCNGYAA